jgi:hypothetical protein
MRVPVGAVATTAVLVELARKSAVAAGSAVNVFVGSVAPSDAAVDVMQRFVFLSSGERAEGAVNVVVASFAFGDRAVDVKVGSVACFGSAVVVVFLVIHKRAGIMVKVRDRKHVRAFGMRAVGVKVLVVFDAAGDLAKRHWCTLRCWLSFKCHFIVSA